MKKYHFGLMLLFLFGLISLGYGQENKNNPSFQLSSRILDAPSNFFGKPAEYLDWQAENQLEAVEDVFSNFPPGYPEVRERYLAFLMLDAVLHDVEAPKRLAVGQFYHRRVANALEEMKRTKVKKGAIVWKLYNMGVVVRTKSVTVGFDITRAKSSGSDSFALPDSIIREIAGQCDVLFISHSHGDHIDAAVAQMFLDKGKPVIVPPDLWKDQPISARLTYPEREAHKIQNISLPAKQSAVKAVIYPGHQGKLANNVSLIVTAEGITFCQTGDQSNSDDFVWIDEVKNHFKVDILIPNCWTTDPPRLAKGFNPRLIIPAHENELGHTIDHREAYLLDYSRWNVPYPKLIMGWGESYHYKSSH